MRKSADPRCARSLFAQFFITPGHRRGNGCSTALRRQEIGLIRRLLSVKLCLMKISKPGLILSSVGLGLTLVFCGQGTNSTLSREQQILRQTIAGLDANANSLPSKDQLLADVERLHKEGKISGEQFETFKKNINEQYVASSGPTNPEAQAKTQKLLEQKIAELNAGQQTAVAPSNPEVQVKAQQALQQKLKEPQRAVPAQAGTGTVAEQALHQKIAELNVEPKPAPPLSAPKAQAKAKQAPKQKLSEPPKAVPAQAETGTVAGPKQRQEGTEWNSGRKPDPPKYTPKAQAKAKPAPKQKLSEPPKAVPAQTETGAVAEQTLHQKIAELNVEPKPAPPLSAPKAQAKAKPAPKQKLSEPPKAGPDQAETGTDAEQRRHQKIDELNVEPKPAPPPSAPKAQAKRKQAPKQKLSEPPKAVPAQAETGTVAEQTLHQKIAELNVEQKPAPPPSAPKAQAKAKQAAKQKIRDPQTGVRAHAETVTVGEQALHQKIAESRTEEKTNFVPEAAGATLTPELEARARELMRLKIAGDRNSGSVQPQSNPEAQAKAVAILNQSETELKAGIRPDTTEQTRILRLKIAESRGTITPAEAAQPVAGPATQSAGVNAQLAAVPTRGTPAIGASPVTFQTSNKTGLARLNELTELYKADKITPSEYHHERAKIVATL